MLAAALQRLDKIGDTDKKVYALENGTSKSRMFRIMSPEQAWQLTHSGLLTLGRAHIYEVLSGPCNLYLDIEWYEADAPTNERERVEAIVGHVLKCIADTYGYVDGIETSYVTASGNVDSRYKCSWHVHVSCPHVCWANAFAVGQFVRASCGQFPEVDKAPYAGKGQNWRCVGSSKATDIRRVFVPATRKSFLACTVQQPVHNRSMIYPVVDIPCALDVPVPDYMLLLANALEPGGNATMCGSDRCVVPFKQLQVCEHVKRKHRSNHQYAVINANTLMWKMQCHACSDMISVWRTFDYSLVQQAFNMQRASYEANANEPPKPGADCSQVTCVDLLACGPPPFREGVVVQCINGIYH